VTRPIPIVALAAGRCGVGAVVLLRPGLLVEVLTGDSRLAARTPWLARMFGVRDLAVGLGTLLALRSGEPLPTWLRMGALCDAGDAAALLLGLRTGRLQSVPAGLVAASALGAAAVGLASAAR
jgi:hypothetical protein